MMFAIGFLAQALFSARIIVQWVVSEKAKKVLSPIIFWVLSIIASYLLFIYGMLREDLAIMFGQVISYYIYIWNLNIKGLWRKLYLPIKIILLITPIIGISYLSYDTQEFIARFINNTHIPMWMLLWGTLGQIIFTLRFVYQWYYSKRRKESALPSGFWWLSIIGSAIIVSYGVFRLDPVLILGQSVGFIAYARNLIIDKKSKHYA